MKFKLMKFKDSLRLRLVDDSELDSAREAVAARAD